MTDRTVEAARLQPPSVTEVAAFACLETVRKTMNATLAISIRVVFCVFGLFLSIGSLMLALVSIQGMSGSEPLQEILIFFTLSFAVAFGLGAVCSLPLTGRYRVWPTAVAFASGGAIGGGALAIGLGLITVFETRLRESTDGGPLGVFVMAAIIGALAMPITIGTRLLRTMTGRRPLDHTDRPPS